MGSYSSADASGLGKLSPLSSWSGQHLSVATLGQEGNRQTNGRDVVIVYEGGCRGLEKEGRKNREKKERTKLGDEERGEKKWQRKTRPSIWGLLSAPRQVLGTFSTSNWELQHD